MEIGEARARIQQPMTAEIMKSREEVIFLRFWIMLAGCEMWKMNGRKK